MKEWPDYRDLSRQIALDSFPDKKTSAMLMICLMSQHTPGITRYD